MRTRNKIRLAVAVMIAAGGVCGVSHAQQQPGTDANALIAEASQRAAWVDQIERGDQVEITPEVRARLDAIDAAAHQKDAMWSGLSWHTDLESALAEAERLNRPVLSLRMLGRLDEEYSCANSRFFRAALYANAEVSACLRGHFVLHWESVRPVPRITIDYGDGRVIESTITGNSIHYVLSPDGEVVDALPGLYGPGVFLEALKEAERVALGRGPEAARSLMLRHPEPEQTPESGRLVYRAIGFAQDFNDGRFERVPEEMAQRAMMTTMSKMFAEMPMLHAVLGLEGEPIEMAIPFEASGYIDRCRLDAPSISLVRTQMGDADERAVSRVIALFEQSMAGDTAMNEETIRPLILAMLEYDSSLRHDLNRLNERVYAEVFMTPSEDAWLGLRDGDAFTGLWTTDRARSGG